MAKPMSRGRGRGQGRGRWGQEGETELIASVDTVRGAVGEPGKDAYDGGGGEEGEEEEAAQNEDRRAWFIGTRARPGARIPAAAVLAGALRLAKARSPRRAIRGRKGGGRKVMMQTLALTSAGGVTLSGTLGQWTSVGPRNVAGRILSLAIQVENGAVALYAGSAGGGVWRSSDTGQTWTPLTEYPFFYAGAVGALAVRGATIYAGTGDRQGYPGIGVLKSSDGGASWALTAALPRATPVEHVTVLALDPGNPNRVYAAALRGGLYMSVNGGGSWTALDDADYLGLVLDPGDPQTIYVTREGEGIFRVDVAGATPTWEAIPLPTSQISGASFQGARLAISGDGRYLYLKVGEGVWRRGPDGAWLSLGLFGGATWAGLVSYVRVDPANPEVVFGAGAAIFYQPSSSTAPVEVTGAYMDQWDLVFDPMTPGVAYAANDDGVYRVDASKQLVTRLSNGLAVTQLYRLAAGPALPGGGDPSLGGGAQDQGVLAVAGGDWAPVAEVAGGDGVAFEVGDPSRCEVYAMFKQLSLRHRAQCDGTFDLVSFSHTAPAFVTPLAVDPADRGILYTATDHLYVSRDHAATWAVVPFKGKVPFSLLSCLTIGPDRKVWAGTQSGLIYASDAAVTQIEKISADIPARVVNDIVVAGTKLYVAVGGFNQATPSTPGHVFVRAPGARGRLTWRRIDGSGSGALPDLPVNALFVDPADFNKIYAATDRSLYRSVDAGTTWAPYDAGLPACVITDLAYWAPTRTLFASTYGRGVFALGLD